MTSLTDSEGEKLMAEVYFNPKAEISISNGAIRYAERNEKKQITNETKGNDK